MAVDRSTVEKILVDAREAVEAAEIPDELRPLAFEKAIDLLSGGSVPAPGAAGGGGGGGEGDGGGRVGGDARLVKIAQKLPGVDVGKLAYVYAIEDDDVSLEMSRSKLDSSKTTATREVALLYAAARQAAGFDDTHTSVARVRQKADDMGVLDGSNFASHVSSIDGMSVRGANAQTREFKVTAHGYEEAAKLIKRITGGGS